MSEPQGHSWAKVVLSDDIETGSPFPLPTGVAIPKRMLDTLNIHKKAGADAQKAIRDLLTRIICDDFDRRIGAEYDANHAVVPAMQFCLQHHGSAGHFLRQLLHLAEQLDQANADSRCAADRINEYVRYTINEDYNGPEMGSTPDYLHPFREPSNDP